MSISRRKRRRSRNSRQGVALGRLSQRLGIRQVWLLLTGGGALALGVILYSLFASGILGSGSAPEKVSADVAPDITLATADGEFRLSEQRGEVLLLYFSFPG